MKKIILLGLLFTSFLLSKDYSLIVAISKYKNIKGLSKEAIEKDIETYKKILKTKNIYNPKILRDSQATKKAIKNYLAYVVKDIKKDRDDRFFMFFAGHGINARDEKYGSKIQSKELRRYLTNSGVILPYEFYEKNFSETIIIGKRDLRPYLKEIDKYIQESLIVFDACYSENSIRGRVNKKRNTPYIYSNPKDYPYKNIVYIASATARNKARSGVLSNVLNSCISTQSNLSKLKTCMNDKLKNIGQRAVVISR